MTRPKHAPHDPALRQLHAEMTALGRILPARSAPPAETPEPDRTDPRTGPRAGADFADAEDLFDNCPL